uniref:Transmembrane protein 33 n=1 Tax=Zea mays TaxID=4577 RepID=A0A804NHS4_MAIZE
MGEEDASAGGDPQRLKRIAAAAYDYENDARWAGYWSNVLVPPHLASRPDVVDHFKRKFYQRYIDPGLVVEPMSSMTSTQSSRPAAKSSATPSSENVRARDSAERTANSLQLDGRTINFSINAWVLVVASLGILPVLPNHISSKAYRLSLLGTICSSAYSLYGTYGKPRAWNMPAIQSWLQSIIVAKDFVHLMFSLMMFTSNVHFKIALLPVLCWALDHVARFLRRNFTHSSLYRKYLEDPCLWVETNNTTLSLLCSNAEITLGFLMIISLFSSRRNIIQTFMYFHLLKLMYHSPVTSGYHQSVWARIGRAVNPYIYRYAPFLNTPISAVQRWWLR